MARAAKPPSGGASAPRPGPAPAPRPMAPLALFDAPLGGTTLVEASAGTGKTFAICGLVLRLLVEHGLAVDQVLVVTFTNAATAELRERIRGRIVQVLAALQGDAVAAKDAFVDGLLAAWSRRGFGALAEPRLALALAHFDEASIHTLHGYSQRALAESPLAAGAPLKQTLLLDDTALREQVAHDLWRRHVAGAPLSMGLAALLREKKDSPQKWADWLRWRAAQPLTTLIWPSASDPAHDSEVDAAMDAAMAADLHASFVRARAAWLAEAAAVVTAVLAAIAATSLHKAQFKPDSVRAARQQWDELLGGADPMLGFKKDSKLHLFGADKLVYIDKATARGDPPLPPLTFFSAAQALLDAREAAAQSAETQRYRLLRRLFDEGLPLLKQAQRDARAITFADMLSALHEQLDGARGDEFAATLRQRHPAALIDEFQDTDPLQWAIVKKIYVGSGAPLVLVGDPKQSIYRFRQADLPTYLKARALSDRQATLLDNQRATEPLLRALNALFGHRDNPFRLPALGYQPVAFGSKLRPVLDDRSQPPRRALHLWTLPLEPDGSAPDKTTARQHSANACAGEIARLLAAAARGEVLLDGRALAAGDIAVLVRSHSQGAQMRQALRAVGVGSVELSNASVWASEEAEAVGHWLAAALAPTREGSVRAALATLPMGRTATELLALDDDAPALAEAMQRLAEYRALWLQRGVAVMLRRWLADHAVPQRLLALADGERRLTNLLHVAELLQAAAADHASPEALHRWLQQQRREGSVDDAALLRLESDRHLVQIVTVHKSKGLEYPLVYCPFLWDGWVGEVARVEGRSFHDGDAGEERAVHDFAPNDSSKPRVKVALQQEAMRMVYVALTRAVHRCVVVVGPYSSRGTTTEWADGPLAWLMNGDPAAFARSCPDAVAIEPIPPGDVPALPPQRPAAETLAALPAPQALPRAWVLSSYSRLTRAAPGDAAARDHDARVLAVPAAASDGTTAAEPAAVPADDILRFPRGPSAGECLHAAFEHADFTDPASWPRAATAALAAHPQPGVNLTPQVHGMLATVLQTALPLGDGRSVQLATVGMVRRLTELEFVLPGDTLRAPALAALLRRHGEAVPPLAFNVLQGPLRGFIDLVFEHNGRFHVLDWKSNHLGETANHYGPANLAAAMDEHGYGLQRLLYVLALHRHLQRCHPGYDYETHMGEALYLFVRGVRPAWPGAGVVAHRPPRALVEGLADWLQST